MKWTSSSVRPTQCFTGPQSQCFQQHSSFHLGQFSTLWMNIHYQDLFLVYTHNYLYRFWLSKLYQKTVSFIIIDFLTRHLFLASRRAEERSLNVPKQALSIFSMMIPLSTAIFQSSRTPTKRELKRRSKAESSKLTEEQKRKAIKSVTMKDGPRPRQLVMIALIWIFSTFLGVERTGDIFLKLCRKY